MLNVQIISALIGAAAGFAYWNYIGCVTGVCPLQTNPWLSTIFGILLGITILPEIYSRISKSADIQYENLSSDEFEARIKSNNVVLVDVRTPSEFNQTHIPGAVNIDYYGSDFKAKISDLEKDKTILVYCRTGRRSADAAVILTQDGYKNVVNLKGGIVRWKGPVAK